MMTNRMAVTLLLIVSVCAQPGSNSLGQDLPAGNAASGSIPNPTSPASESQKSIAPSPKSPSLVQTHQDAIADQQDIDFLLSPHFGERQQGIHRIVARGIDGIEWVKANAGHGDIDFASCCVAILYEIGQNAETKDAAIQTLEFLSEEKSFLASKLAKQHALQLQENEVGRTIRILEAEGVRLYRRGNTDEVTSASNIETDRQCRLLLNLPTVGSVSATGQRITNRGLRSIAKIESLNNLSLFRTTISDGGLHVLREATNLSRLALSGDFSELGFQKLAAIQGLKHLSVYQSVTEQDLEVICKFPLETLHLGGVSLSDRAADLFASMSKLRSLSVDLTNVENGDLSWIQNGEDLSLSLSITSSPKFDDRGLRQLSKTQVSRLSLYGTGISLEAIPILCDFPKLNSLTIVGTPLDDDAIQPLEKLKKLRMLMLRDTGVTQEGIKKLQAKLPALRYARTSG